jgi:hypothetical protein
VHASAPAPASSALDRLAPWAWLLLPLACHLGFSWIGFNPTDDGWMQAVARRMANGEFPHRDFIFVRPALSAVLQIPLVWLGGDYTIWLSRLWGWLTIGGIAWLWSGFAQPGRTVWSVRYPLFATAFFLTAHVFPVMAWHSLDGLLLGTAAVWFAARGTLGGLRAAFVCVGLAALCRQNFALFGPLLLLAIPDPRKWRTMFWAALPPLGYLGATLAAGCLPDFLRQVTSPGGALRSVAWQNYLDSPHFLPAIVLGALAAGILHRAGSRHAAIAGVMALGVPVLAAGLAAHRLTQGPGPFHAVAYSFFGLALGLTLVAAVLRRGLAPADRLPLAAGLALAWVTTVSIGWNSPALATGLVLVVIWRVSHLLAQPLAAAAAPVGRGGALAGLAMLALVSLAFRHARQIYPYRDAATPELTYEVGPVFPGAAGLRTNVRTFAVLQDLRRQLDQFEADGTPYALLTDCAAVWIRSPQANPLPCEWPQITELGYDQRLVDRMTGALRRLPPNTRILVQRVLISELSYTLAPLGAEWSYYAVQNWVRAHGQRVGQTAYFEIYAPPTAP